MARRFTIEILMNLAKSIGANPQKFMGTRTNISFLGKGPTKNPLFQGLLPGPETSKVLLGPERIEGTISAVNDAMAYVTAGKLNSIQTEMLGNNLLGLKNILHPPVLPSASVTAIRPGIEGLRRFPKETRIERMVGEGKLPTRDEMRKKLAEVRFPKESHKFFGRPLKDKDFSEIDRMVMEGKIPDARGRTWNFKTQGPGTFNAALNQKTGMSRAIARQILQQDTRIKLKPEELFMLKEGKGEPLDLMRKYYGESMANLDAFLDNVIPRPGMNIKDIASRVLAEVELIPAFAEGGLAEVLQAPRKGYWEGLKVDNLIGPRLPEKKVVQPSFSPYKSRAQLIAESGIDTGGSFLDFLSEKSRIGSDNVGVKFSPSAELNLSKSASQDYQIKNKNIWMALSSMFNIGPFSADIDYNKYKDKIKVKSQEEGATVFKDAMDDERLAYRLGYNKDDLNINLRSDKKLKDFYLTLNKVFKRKPKILGKAKGGLARILEV